MAEFLQNIRILEYEDTPDYAYFKKGFKKAASGGSQDLIFE